LAGAACKKVKHCQDGASRCIGGACDDDQCDFDLICVVRDEGGRTCGKDLGDDEYDFGSKGKGKGKPASEVGPACSCDAPELCTMDTETCVNYCEVPPADQLPGSGEAPEVIFCEQASGEQPLKFEDICKRRCELTCQRWQQFCDYQCAADYCDGADILAACKADCPTNEGAPEACLTRDCNTVRDLGCAEVTCPDTNKPANCTGVLCKNTCGGTTSPEWAGDGVCDDGDPSNAATASCTWGTDCTDCGPRAGEAPEAQPQGGLCAFNTGCKGYTEDLAKNEAWCMSFADVEAKLQRCVPDCSHGELCPEGYQCVAVVDASGKPVESGDLKGQACVPAMCGG
jgi:hypothetical protein